MNALGAEVVDGKGGKGALERRRGGEGEKQTDGRGRASPGESGRTT